jgi:predicted ATPase
MGKNKFLDSFATNLAPFLYKLKTDFISDYQNIVSAVQTVAPYFQDFDFNNNLKLSHHNMGFYTFLCRECLQNLQCIKYRFHYLFATQKDTRSGKSNFISVFRLLENIYNQRLQSYIKQNGGSERFFYFGSKTTKEIIIDVVLADNENSNNGYFLRLKKNTDADALFVDYDQASFHNKIDHPKQPYTKEITNSKDESSMKHNVQRIVEYSKTFLRQCKLYHFHDTSSAAGFKSFQDIGKNKFLDSFATNLAPFLYRLKTDFSSDYQNIVSAVQTVAPYFQDFDFNIEGENILLRVSLSFRLYYQLFLYIKVFYTYFFCESLLGRSQQIKHLHLRINF